MSSYTIFHRGGGGGKKKPNVRGGKCPAPVEIQSNMQIAFVIFMSAVKNLQHDSTLDSPDKTNFDVILGNYRKYLSIYGK